MGKCVVDHTEASVSRIQPLESAMRLHGRPLSANVSLDWADLIALKPPVVVVLDTTAGRMGDVSLIPACVTQAGVAHGAMYKSAPTIALAQITALVLL